jgi:glutathione synthase
MTIKLGVVMDPIATINPKKDSTLAMLLASQDRGWTLTYMEQRDLFVQNGEPLARMRDVRVRDNLDDWFELDNERTGALHGLDVILMRRDPPFEMEYIYATYVLGLAERQGTLVVNRPASLRSWNEKLSIAWFPQCAPPTLVTREKERIHLFIREQGEAVVKPLDGMGGHSIFRLRADDPNVNVVLETITQHETRTVMAQRFLPEISAGDKRILLVDGEPVPGALARIPAAGESRGNLARGARGEGSPLSERERWICAEVGPTLRDKGLIFVGLDVIGDYLTEINVTSPTGIREIDQLFGLNVSSTLLDAIERRLSSARADMAPAVDSV